MSRHRFVTRLDLYNLHIRDACRRKLTGENEKMDAKKFERGIKTEMKRNERILRVVSFLTVNSQLN